MTQYTGVVSSTPPGHNTVKPRLLVVALAAAGIVVALAQTLVIPLVGDLPTMFNTDVAAASWVVTVTLLVGAVTMPVLGNLADLYGKKQLILVAMLSFIIGSVICAAALNITFMILGRGLQGVGMGMIPIGLSFIHDALPQEKVGSAIAMVSSALGMGGALGLSAAAAIAQFFTWRILFWSVAILAVAAMITIALALPTLLPSSQQITQVEHKNRDQRVNAQEPARFDVIGAIALTIGLTGLLFGISQGTEWGWLSPLTLSILGSSVVILFSWGIYQWHKTNPLVDLRTCIHPVVLLTNIATIFFGFTMYAANLIIPQIMQLPVHVGYGLGQSMIHMGLWMVPLGLGVVCFSEVGARISSHKGPKTTLVWAGVIITTGYIFATLTMATIGNRSPGQADKETLLWTLILLCAAAFIIGCGMGLAYGATPSLIMSAVSPTEKASANGINALVRSTGMTISAAFIGTILGGMSQHVGELLIPTHAGFLIALSSGAVAALIASGIVASIPIQKKVRLPTVQETSTPSP